MFLRGVDLAQATCRAILFQIINKIFIVRTEEKKLLVRPNSRWEDNIKIYAKGIWIAVIWLRVGHTGDCCKRDSQRSGFLKCGEFY
jgi:hypothetical protein